MEHKLSIVIITMNREDQLEEAIRSCLASDLPKNTQFVIIDNGSTDNTQDMICALQKECEGKDVVIDYFLMKENLGISAGRNAGKERATGEYAYFMDDDAIISEESRSCFFTSCIEMLDSHPDMAAMTTCVYDETLVMWRESVKSKLYTKERPEVYMFHGNTYFIRQSVPGMLFIPSMRYAYEDMYLSIVIQSRGMYVGLNDKVHIIHKPKVNKWKKGSESLFEICVKANGALLTIKTSLYPVWYHPFVYLAYLTRCYKTSRFKNHMIKISWKLFKEQTKGIKVEKISSRDVRMLIKKYGFMKAM